MFSNVFSKSALALSLLALAACQSIGGSDMNPAAVVTGGKDDVAMQESMRKFAATTVCPEVQVQDGTQLYRLFEPGKQDDLSGVRFQATLLKFARECRTDPMTGTTTIKVGMQGRLLAGPSAATGTVDLPLRVVLLKDGDQVIYSELHKTAATINQGDSAADWVKVVDGLTVTAAESAGRFVIYVGFDEGAKKS
jgi:hypothetical protein